MPSLRATCLKLSQLTLVIASGRPVCRQAGSPEAIFRLQPSLREIASPCLLTSWARLAMTINPSSLRVSGFCRHCEGVKRPKQSQRLQCVGATHGLTIKYDKNSIELEIEHKDNSNEVKKNEQRTTRCAKGIGIRV